MSQAAAEAKGAKLKRVSRIWTPYWILFAPWHAIADSSTVRDVKQQTLTWMHI